MHFSEFVDRSWYTLHARLELKRQELRVVPRLVQVAAVKPQAGLPRWLPHVAKLTFPRSWVLCCSRTQTPAFADLVGDFLRHDLRNIAVHRPVARCINDQIGRKLRTVVEHYRVRPDLGYADAAAQLDRTVGHQLRRAHVDVVA